MPSKPNPTMNSGQCGYQQYGRWIWWADKAFNADRHIYAGHTLNEIIAPSARVRSDNMRSIALMENETGIYPEQIESTNGRIMTQSVAEVPNQIAIIRENRHRSALGSVMFRAEFLATNPHGFTDYLKETTYSYPAVPPAMEWLPQNKPAAPVELAAIPDEGSGGYILHWNRNAENTHDFKRYVLYSLKEPPVAGVAIPDGSVRALRASEEVIIPASDIPFGTSYWVVSELGTSNQESDLSNVVTVENDPAPVITNPAQEENLITESFARFEWEPIQGLSSYHYQWADNAAFTAPLAENEALDPGLTARLFNGLNGGNTYYFRLRAKNNTGWSDWTRTYKVTIDQKVTGIGESQFYHRLNIYPNPADKNMLIGLALTKRSDVNARLLTIDGRFLFQVADGTYDAGEYLIDIKRSKMLKGVYLLVLWVDDQQKVQRVVFY